MSVSDKIALTIATGERVHDKVEPLIDGRVKIDDCRLSFVRLGRGEMLVRAFEDRELNVAELSLSNYVTRRGRGDCPYTAIPVYIARSFRHADLYVRSDRIVEPADLRGKRIGIAEYEHTLYVWVRGLLEDEYGVRPADVKWISVSHHAPGPGEPVRPPANVSIEVRHSTGTLSEMLERGEIDALVSVLPPPCFTGGAANVARLFADTRAVEEDYFRRTGIFPILHVMGIRNELVERHPGLARKVFRAFVAAKDLALAADASAAASDDARATHLARMTALMGRDYYSYGLAERDRRTLDLFLDYHVRQGLSARRLALAELFSPVPLSQYEDG